jgi:dTMP kinase
MSTDLETTVDPRTATARESLPGRLIAVEGLDGSGKSTQIHLVHRWLELEGYKVFFTEWNSSALVKQSTKKGKKKELLTPTTFAMIHATDFADRYERQILPQLHAGYIVLADRYVFTAFARDAARGCDRKWIRQLYGFARMPDLTFFFDLPPAVALGRILEGRPKLKHYEAGLDLGLSRDPYECFRLFQKRINDEYQRMAGEYGFVRLDATQPSDVQQQGVRQAVERAIDLTGFEYKWRVGS